jgi:hypothetical protein
MSDSKSKHSSKRSSMRPHSSYSETNNLFMGVHAGSGVSIQCQFCPGQGFRRSTLRAEDLKDVFLMRYPVRCLRCSQRQLVSFTVAGISIPSHIKQRRAKQIVMQHKHWAEPSTETTEERPAP